MKQDIKENILHASEKLFYTNGYNDTSLRSIADELGIHHTNILYYFKNKKELGDVVYSMLYRSVASEIALMIPQRDIYYIATNLRLHYKVMYWNKNIFQLYADFINAGIVTEYVEPIAVQNYHLYTEAFNIKLSDNELDAIFHLAQAIEQRYINLVIAHKSPISFERAVDMIIKAPLLYMGVDYNDINHIITQSMINVNLIPNERVAEIVNGLIIEQ